MRDSTRTCHNAASKFPEIRSEMTTCALISKAAVVHVVTVMTIYTAPPGRVHLLPWAGVARYASELLMRTVDYESRFLVMVEVPDPPVACVVASITSTPQASFVRIVLTMAAHAGLRRVLEARSLVTVAARHF